MPAGSTLTQEQVIAHCKQSIAGFKCPKAVVFRNDPLPLSGAGKVLKTELRKPFWEGKKQTIYATNNDAKSTYA